MPIVVTTDVNTEGVIFTRVPLVHHRRGLVSAKSALKLTEAAAIVCLQPVVEDNVAVAASAIWDVVKCSGLFHRCDVWLGRSAFVAVEARFALGSFVVTQIMQTAVSKDDVTVTT